MESIGGSQDAHQKPGLLTDRVGIEFCLNAVILLSLQRALIHISLRVGASTTSSPSRLALPAANVIVFMDGSTNLVRVEDS